MTHKLKNNKLLHLTDNTLRSLGQNRIRTILEFLQEDPIKLVTITKLSLSQILDVRNDIFSKYSAPVRNGIALLKDIATKKLKLSTGLKSIDVMLDGGLPLGCITEVCGLADSGKTQLCFQLAINCVKDSNDLVLYIDTKGDFSAVRIQRILENSGFAHEEMASVMYKIKVIRIWTINEIIDLFQHLKKGTSGRNLYERLKLIIIDSLPCLMFQFLGDDNKIGLTLLNTLVNYSRYLAKELNISIVCVNIQTRWIDQDMADLEEDEDLSTVSKDNFVEKRNRCLGKYWQHIPLLVLLIERNQQNLPTENVCVMKTEVSVLKSNVPEIYSTKCTVDLGEIGIT